MEIKIDVSFSEAQKAVIVSRGEQIPSSESSFKVSPPYVEILKHFKGNFTVSNESIFVKSNVEYTGIDGYHFISLRISEMIEKGTLKEGDCIDTIMQEFADIIKADKLNRAEKAKMISKSDELYRRSDQQRKWNQYNERKIKSRESAIKNAKKEAELERLEAEKHTWIELNGSLRLRKGIEHGHNCQKQYVIERSTSTLGNGYILDYEGDVETKNRSCPSLEAIEDVEAFQSRNHPEIQNVKVVWLPHGFVELNTQSNGKYSNKGCEAVEVKLKYLKGYWYRTF